MKAVAEPQSPLSGLIAPYVFLGRNRENLSCLCLRKSEVVTGFKDANGARPADRCPRPSVSAPREESGQNMFSLRSVPMFVPTELASGCWTRSLEPPPPTRRGQAWGCLAAEELAQQDLLGWTGMKGQQSLAGGCLPLA